MVRLFIFIYRLLKGKYPEYSGGCLKFYFLLKKLFNGRGYYNSSHVITKIGNNFYDINGEVKDSAGYIPIEEFGLTHIVSAFREVVPKSKIINNF